MAQKVILFEIAALFLTLSFIIQNDLDFERAQSGLTGELVLWPGEFMTGFVTMGFKPVAADLLWLKADEFWHRGLTHRILPILKTIALMEPKFVLAWSLGAWHLSYNLSAEARTEREANALVAEGIKFLKEGLARNRERYDLYFELGWIYFDKLKDYETAIKYFRGATRYPHPEYIDRLIVHAQKKQKGDVPFGDTPVASGVSQSVTSPTNPTNLQNEIRDIFGYTQ